MIQKTIDFSWIELRDISNKISVSDGFLFATDDEAGAVNFFVGTVRNHTQAKKVKFLVYEAYEKMAILELKKIADECQKLFLTNKIYIVHALGHLQIGDIAILIVVSAPHRAASFEACRFVIEEVKKRVPIWKKEHFEDGEVWVSAFP